MEWFNIWIEYPKNGIWLHLEIEIHKLCFQNYIFRSYHFISVITFVRANLRANQQLHIPSCTLNLHVGYYFSTLFPTFVLSFYHNQWFSFNMKNISVLYFFIFWKSRKSFGQWLSCFTCACLLNIFAVWFCISLYLSYYCCLDDNPPDNKTSWRRHNDVSLCVPATSQVRLK